MCRLLEAIEHEAQAADELTRACVRHGALIDATANDNPFVSAIRKQYRVASITPNDMLSVLSRMK